MRGRGWISASRCAAAPTTRRSRRSSGRRGPGVRIGGRSSAWPWPSGARCSRPTRCAPIPTGRCTRGAGEVGVHADWRAFREAVAPERCLYFSARAERSFWDAPYRDRMVLVFGNETDGLPERIREKHADRLYRIPTLPAVRSLNLATAVGIVLYEALRQLTGASPRLEWPAGQLAGV